MDKNRRKELQDQYKEMKTVMGIYQIRNIQNGKIFVDGFPNLKNRWITMKMQLDMGQFVNKALQEDYKATGEDHFVYEVLEEIEVKDHVNARWIIKTKKQEWLEKLQPYGEKGYNKEKKTSEIKEKSI